MKSIVDLSEVLLLAGLSAVCTETERAIVADCLKLAESAVRKYLQYDPVQAVRTEYYPQTDMRKEGRQGVWEVSDTQAYVRELAEFASTELQVKHIPIRSITSLNIDYDGRNGTRPGAFGAGTLQVEGVDYWPNYDSEDSAGHRVCFDGILRSEGAWPDLPGCVKLVYTAGYTVDELRGRDDVIDAGEISAAVKVETQRRVLEVFNRIKTSRGFSGPITGEGLGDYNYTTNSALIQGLVDGMRDLLPQTQHKLQEFLRMDMGIM